MKTVTYLHAHPAPPPPRRAWRAGGAWIAWGLLLLNGALMAGIYATARQAAQAGVPFETLLAWQVMIAAAVLALVLVVRGERAQLRPQNLRYALFSGLIGVTGPNLLIFAALAHLPTGIVGALTALSPVFTYAIAAGLRLEAPRALGIIGVLSGLLGALLIARPDPAAISAASQLWLLPALAAPLLLAAGNVYRTTAWPEGLRPRPAAALLLGLQCLIVVPVAAASSGLAVPTAGIPAVLGAGALMGAFYLTAFELQRRAGPVLVGQMGNVISIASLGIGALWLGETYAPLTLAGAAVIIAGVVTLTLRERGATRRREARGAA